MYQHIIDYYSFGFGVIAKAGCRREKGKPDEAAILYANAEWFWRAMCVYIRAQGDCGYLGHRGYKHPTRKASRR